MFKLVLYGVQTIFSTRIPASFTIGTNVTQTIQQQAPDMGYGRHPRYRDLWSKQLCEQCISLAEHHTFFFRVCVVIAEQMQNSMYCEHR